MTKRFGFRIILTAAVATLLWATTITAQPPLALGATRVTINGTSNIHAYTASTTTVRLVRGEFGAIASGSDPWSQVLNPGAIDAFEVAIPAATLTSPREGLDKNMHKALKIDQHADITFHVLRVEPLDGGAAKVTGVLRIAGVERQVMLDVKTQRTTNGLAVSGQTTLLMTDFGIKPPTAMLGMLKTDPKVTVAFETTVRIPLT